LASLQLEADNQRPSKPKTMTSKSNGTSDSTKQMWLQFAFAFFLTFSVAASCLAQPAPQHEPAKADDERPASASHNYMELFTRLERDWVQAMQKKDKASLEAILAPEFVLRTSENPENPLPRADWIQQALTSYDIHSSTQRAMAIRAFLGVAVVSFVQSEQAFIDGKDRSGDYFVVDLWEAHHDKWQVAARYIAPAGNHLAGESQTKAPK
jgi:hypothetical protein